MLAGYIARQTGREAAEIARAIALATTGFAIVVTLLMASLAHQAVSLVMRGLGVPGANRRENRTSGGWASRSR